jgi:hypothetical protein
MKVPCGIRWLPARDDSRNPQPPISICRMNESSKAKSASCRVRVSGTRAREREVLGVGCVRKKTKGAQHQVRRYPLRISSLEEEEYAPHRYVRTWYLSLSENLRTIACTQSLMKSKSCEGEHLTHLESVNPIVRHPFRTLRAGIRTDVTRN